MTATPRSVPRTPGARLALAAVVLPLLVSACSAGRTATTAPRASESGAALDQATLITRCLPQLTREGYHDGSSVTVKALSTTTVLPAKPLVAHHAGDLVAFVGQEQIPQKSRVSWARLTALCKVPASTPNGAPGSDPLPASQTVPSRADHARDLQLCTEAPDLSGPEDAGVYDENQVVVPDVRAWKVGSEAWGGPHTGIAVIADHEEGGSALCTYGIYGPDPAVLSASATTRLEQPYAYLHDDGTDHYYAAGLIPTDDNNVAPLASTIEITPPGRPTQRFPVRATGTAGNAGTGTYAIAMSFPSVTTPLGESHTRVRVLAENGAVVWSGTWDVGVEGH